MLPLSAIPELGCAISSLAKLQERRSSSPGLSLTFLFPSSCNWRPQTSYFISLSSQILFCKVGIIWSPHPVVRIYSVTCGYLALLTPFAKETVFVTPTACSRHSENTFFSPTVSWPSMFVFLTSKALSLVFCFFTFTHIYSFNIYWWLHTPSIVLGSGG